MEQADFDKLTDTGKFRAITDAEARAEKAEQLINPVRRNAIGLVRALIAIIKAAPEWKELKDIFVSMMIESELHPARDVQKTKG